MMLMQAPTIGVQINVDCDVPTTQQRSQAIYTTGKQPFRYQVDLEMSQTSSIKDTQILTEHDPSVTARIYLLLYLNE